MVVYEESVVIRCAREWKIYSGSNVGKRIGVEMDFDRGTSEGLKRDLGDGEVEDSGVSPGRDDF